MITFVHKGNFNKLEQFLAKSLRRDYLNDLDQLGKEGVDSLSSYTPKDSGETASGWNYEIHHSSTQTEIVWINEHIHSGVPIAVILQYGHGTKNGGYVQGIDYINPAMAPIFQKIADRAWKVVTDS